MKGSVDLAMDDGSLRRLPADLFGEWAVHKGPRWVHGRGQPRPAWTITHKPSGMRAGCWATCGISKAVAFKIARHLARQTFTVAPPDEAFGLAVYREILRALGLRDPHTPEAKA